MLDLLVKYAADQGLVTEPGFKPKRVRWALVFDGRGRFLNLQELGDADAKNNPGREFGKCPDLSQPELKAGGAGCRHFLVDNAEVVALYTKGGVKDDDRAKLAAKHNYFVDLLRQASSVVLDLGPIADRLNDPDTLEKIRSAMAAAKAKPTENVTLAVMQDGVNFLVDSPRWHDWWRNFRRKVGERTPNSKDGTAAARGLMRCLASGELVEPATTHPKIEGLADVGGLSMGDALASFKQDAFRSYGLERSANAAVSEEMAAGYRAALNQLIKMNGKRLSGAKVVHWYSGTVPPDQDPVNHIAEGDQLDDEWENDPIDLRQEAADAEKRGKELVESFDTAGGADLLDYRYYMLTLSGASGRVMVRDWFEGQFGQLRENRDAWFSDLAVVHRNGGELARKPKFMAVLGGLVRELRDIPPPLETKMWRVAVRYESIPEQAMAQALARAKIAVVADAPPNHACIGLLKAYHVRKGDPFMEPYLNEEHPHPAYHCGRLMAVLADIQRGALGEVGAGVIQRYYPAASATPALVLGPLVRNAQFHLAKIEAGLRQWHDSRLAGVLARIRDQVPKTLTLEEQSLFALGYYQQKAARGRKVPDKAEPTADINGAG